MLLQLDKLALRCRIAAPGGLFRPVAHSFQRVTFRMPILVADIQNERPLRVLNQLVAERFIKELSAKRNSSA